MTTNDHPSQYVAVHVDNWMLSWIYSLKNIKRYVINRTIRLADVDTDINVWQLEYIRVELLQSMWTYVETHGLVVLASSPMEDQVFDDSYMKRIGRCRMTFLAIERAELPPFEEWRRFPEGTYKSLSGDLDE